MISVIMLTYNRDRLVSRAIESILAQTWQDFEFLIVDNGSTDHSGQIADEYAAMDNRIRVIHRERGSIGAGRNAGLDAARGDNIAFVDDDDYVKADYLAYLHQLSEKHDADIAVCGSWRETAGIRQPKYVFDGIFTYCGEDAVVEMLKRERFNAGTPAKLIAAKIFEGLRYDNGKKYDDIGMTYKLFAGASRAAVSGLPLYICARHGGNNSTGTAQNESIPKGQIEEYLDTFRERTRWLTERFPDKADFWLYTELSYALSMYEKTTDLQTKAQLRQLLRRQAEGLCAAKRFYTPRDSLLLRTYQEEIFEGLGGNTPVWLQ